MQKTDLKRLFVRAGGEWHVACDTAIGGVCGTCSILISCERRTRSLCERLLGLNSGHFRKIEREDALDALDSAEAPS